MPQDPLSYWDALNIGDTAPPHELEITAEGIAQYCRNARYENLVYTNQAAAQESGLPGITAPPGMALVYCPVKLTGLIPSTQDSESLPWPVNPTRVTVQFQGVIVTPGDLITSLTSVQEKGLLEKDRFVTLRVVARNQRGELVSDCSYTYSFPESQG